MSQCFGLWKPSKFNFIICLFIGLICLFQLGFDLYIFISCSRPDCGFVERVTEAKNMSKSDRTTEKTAYTLSSVGSAASYICLVISLLLLSRRNKKALEPFQAIEDLSRVHLCVLCISVTFCFVFFASSVVLCCKIVVPIQPKDKYFLLLVIGGGAQFLAQWASIVGIHVFGVSSLALGKMNAKPILQLLNLTLNVLIALFFKHFFGPQCTF